MSIESMRKRFCKDCGYKINVFSDDLFFDALLKIDNAVEKYDDFEEMVCKMGGEKAFLDYYDSVKDKAIQAIIKSSGYKKFNSEDFNKYSLKNMYPTKPIYNYDNIGKYFLSIDMRKANFNALKHYAPDIFQNKPTWEDFLKQFTNEDYILKSKNIRQVIMGNVNPKRQETYEKFIMDKLFKKVSHLFKDLSLKSFNKDELVFEIDGPYEYNKIKNQLNKILEEFTVPTSVEVFNLAAVKDKNEKIQGYIKEFSDNTYEFKAIDSNILNIAQKIYLNQKIEDEDLMFETPFGVAKLIKQPEFKIISSTKNHLIKEEDILL
jgi:hypothetical protein